MLMMWNLKRNSVMNNQWSWNWFCYVSLFEARPESIYEVRWVLTVLKLKCVRQWKEKRAEENLLR